MTGIDRKGKSLLTNNIKYAIIKTDFKATFKIVYGVLINKLMT